jgi:hypothetical protein
MTETDKLMIKMCNTIGTPIIRYCSTDGCPPFR